MKLNKEKVIGAIQKVDGLIEAYYHLDGDYCVVGACLISIGFKPNDRYNFEDIGGDGIQNYEEAFSQLTEEFGGDEENWVAVQAINDGFIEDDDYGHPLYEEPKLARKESVIQFIKDMPEAK